MARKRRPHPPLPDAAKPLDDFDRMARQRLGLPPDKPVRPPPRRGALARLLMLTLIAAALIIVLIQFHRHSLTPPLPPATGTLSVTFFDVGQGDSTLIQTAAGKSILIDTGPPSARGKLFTDLELSNVRRLDMLILTHADSDHSGNTESILQHIPTAMVIDNGFDTHSPTLIRLQGEMARAMHPGGTLPGAFVVGTSTDLGSGASIHYLAPLTRFSGANSANENSIILRVSFGQVSILLTGDAGQREIGTLLSRKAELRSTVLKIAHHGSASSTSLPFLDRVAPSAAVISCGLGNRYAHPDLALLGTLRYRGIQIWRTDLQGTIRFRTNGTTYQFLPSIK